MIDAWRRPRPTLEINHSDLTPAIRPRRIAPLGLDPYPQFSARPLRFGRGPEDFLGSAHPPYAARPFRLGRTKNGLTPLQQRP